eukprot:NODE_1656_length_1423_cov_26.699846_g1572_i0.p1 GENE.NODE_1656_length_1423_cov_26.699846_g1572_i0~~NODE_1656_length_1423_cov_26.699846_g1572_i0.p1  ORF type:complete len:411 (-),score=91.18 NODE_1656_length_1423_cov_26.699846_g1572_i0:48-1280(-)
MEPTLKGGSLPGTNLYGAHTLIGNWYETQQDPRYCPQRAKLLSDQEQHWQSENQHSMGHSGSRSLRAEPKRWQAPPDDTSTWQTETSSQFTTPAERKPLERFFLGGKSLIRQDPRPMEEQVAEYTEKWTKNSLKHRAKMTTESGRSFVTPTHAVHANLRLFGIPTVDKVRERIWRRAGKAGFRGLARVLKIMDDNGNRKLDRYELMNGLQTYGLNFTPSEMDDIMNYFDTDGSGTITITEFVRTLRGPMSQERRDFVAMAYDLLDTNGDQTVTFAEVRRLYDVSKHPDVLSKSKTAEQVLQEFIQCWDKNGDSTVEFDEFVDYYEDISTGIDDDRYFELMIRNAWHISGGEGVCANTSCRRVLVVHTDGRQTVEEIKNDLGIGPDDIAKMDANLRQQGITDIKKINLYSG